MERGDALVASRETRRGGRTFGAIARRVRSRACRGCGSRGLLAGGPIRGEFHTLLPLTRAKQPPASTPVSLLEGTSCGSARARGDDATAPRGEAAAADRRLDYDVRPRDCVPTHGRVHACSRSTARQTATTAVELELGSHDGLDGTMVSTARDRASPATRTTAFAVSPPRLARLQRRRLDRTDRLRTATGSPATAIVLTGRPDDR
jgi:hypothetical protein